MILHHAKCLVIFLFVIQQAIAQDNSVNQVIPHEVNNGQIARSKTGIVLAGSSITWGDGSICSRFGGSVVDFMLSELSAIRMCDEMEYFLVPISFNNPKQYKGIGKMINGLHNKISFNLTGDEIAICQTMLRTTDFGIIQVKADGVIIGSFVNKNTTLGTDNQKFIGDGLTLKFKLNYPYTYEHEVRVDGKLLHGSIYAGGWSRESPDNDSYLIIRKFDDNQKPIHFIWFKEPPANGSKIKVNYKYGKVIMFEGSSVGQTGSDEKNESEYGEGDTSFDTTKPAVLSSGLEYRYIDKRAFWIHKFTESKTRHFEIEIIGGTNPYFIVNYASNRYHDFMNAGIGGWSLAKYLDTDGINDYNGIFERFMPDVIVMECATNDDWAYKKRKLKRMVTGLNEKEVKNLWTLELDQVTYQPTSKDFKAQLCNGIISDIDEISLTCPQIVGSDVQPGDIIRIGNYHGDNRQVAVREVSGVNLMEGKVSWLQPLNPGLIMNVDQLDDLIDAECVVRDLSGYQKKYEEMIDKLQQVAPHAQVLLTQPGLSNYWWRQLWGYEIVHRKLATKYHNVNTIEVTDWLQEFQSHNISGNSFIELPANGKTKYELPWEGIWQGFQVWVNDEDIYGTDCYIESGAGYSIDPEGHGADLNISRGYDKSHRIEKPMRLIFTKNAPKNGIIRVVRADTIWSDDLCHTDERTGAFVYGQIYITRLRDVLR